MLRPLESRASAAAHARAYGGTSGGDPPPRQVAAG